MWLLVLVGFCLAVGGGSMRLADWLERHTDGALEEAHDDALAVVGQSYHEPKGR